jgi:hypothetical protein
MVMPENRLGVNALQQDDDNFDIVQTPTYVYYVVCCRVLKRQGSPQLFPGFGRPTKLVL